MKKITLVFRGAAALAVLAVASPALPCGDTVTMASQTPMSKKDEAPPAFTVQAPKPAVASNVPAKATKVVKSTASPKRTVAAN